MQHGGCPGGDICDSVDGFNPGEQRGRAQTLPRCCFWWLALPVRGLEHLDIVDQFNPAINIGLAVRLERVELLAKRV